MPRSPSSVQEHELVDIHSWTEMRSRRSFVDILDPKVSKLRKIIGGYRLEPMQGCGLSTCRQNHNSGFLVVTDDGSETNLGGHCGKTHFPNDFSRFSADFKRVSTDRDRRIRFAQHLQNIEVVRHRLDEFKQKPRGGNWLDRCVSSFVKGCPHKVMSDLQRRAELDDGDIVDSRRRSKEEVDDAVASGLGRAIDVQYEQRFVGRIEGISALSARNSLRAILVEGVDRVLSRLAAESAKPTGKLVALLNDADRIAAQFELAESALKTGRAFFTSANLAKVCLLPTARGSPEISAITLNEATGTVSVKLRK